MKLDLDAEAAVDKRKLLKKYTRSPSKRPPSSTHQLGGPENTTESASKPSLLLPRAGISDSQRPTSAAAASGSRNRANLGAALQRPGTAGAIRQGGDQPNIKKGLGYQRGGEEVGDSAGAAAAWAGHRSSEDLLEEKQRLLHGVSAKKEKRQNGLL
jgi:hypothetical protein